LLAGTLMIRQIRTTNADAREMPLDGVEAL
jgi:hypothetical protein